MIRPLAPVFSICYIADSIPTLVEVQDLNGLEQTQTFFSLP